MTPVTEKIVVLCPTDSTVAPTDGSAKKCMKPLNPNNITIIPIDQVKPNPANARAHSDHQVAQIARSIENFGFTQPILVDENMMILAGFGRWLACQTLHMPKCRCS